MVGGTFALEIMLVDFAARGIRRAEILLTLDFDQDRQVLSPALVPGREGRKELEIFTVRCDVHVETLAAFWRCLVERRAVFEMGRKFFGVWWAESERSAVRRRNSLACRIELQRTGEGERSHQLWRSDKRVGFWIPIVSADKVAIVRRDHGVRRSLSERC